ncbi:MAG: class I SAM-dependent methyltransferase [Gordonia sp. (in: high G+C Gram-positive bacteria)]|uniref:class I SAM-dependent DNA methyltransferase n=1 Tax=Gordonia sp. (in: high G+C Gram-positive bacteria) TaxID=84139 RepID=UPI003BB728CD
MTTHATPVSDDREPGGPIFQHPLAYAIGIEGLALLRAFAGEYDREFTLRRLNEIRHLLDEGDPLGEGRYVEPTSAPSGYATWAQRYDGPGNSLFEIEEAITLPILDSLPKGIAVDAGCGTGRLAGYLASRGHQVSGFDSSPDMLDLARAKNPDVSFGVADLRSLPVNDSSVDLVVSALALAHIRDLAPVFKEWARVLNAGGNLVVSDTRGQFPGSHLYPCVEALPTGDFGYIPSWRHATAEYIRAALDSGFNLVDCHEPLQHASLPSKEKYVPDNPAEPPSEWSPAEWCTTDLSERVPPT